MANKTIYLRDSDLPLWDLAQDQLGQSISALFSEFLREKVKTMDVFIHVLRSAPHSHDLAVMFSPARPVEGGGLGNPHYLKEAKLTSYLESRGIASGAATRIALGLKNTQSVSELISISRRRTAMSRHFQANTQYGDWEGTAAADEFGDNTDQLDRLFEATGKVNPDKEIMIGFEFYYIEGTFYCSGYFHPSPEGSDPSLKAKFQKDQMNPIQVKEVRLELTLEKFFKCFKRFNVVLLNAAIDINGREYEANEN